MATPYPFEGSELQVKYIATAEGMRVVNEILHKKYPNPGKPIELFVLNEVNYYIKDDVVHKNDRAEAVVKMVDALPERLRMQGMRKGVFPNKVGSDFVKEAHAFFESNEGKMFLKKMFEPAEYGPSSVGGPACPSSSYGTIPGMSGTKIEGPKPMSIMASMKSVGISHKVDPALQTYEFVSEKVGPKYVGLVGGNASDGKTLVVVTGLIIFITIYLCERLWFGTK